MDRMNNQNDSPVSLGRSLGGRLKNHRDLDKWTYLRLCLSVKAMPVTRETWTVLAQLGWVSWCFVLHQKTIIRTIIRT